MSNQNPDLRLRLTYPPGHLEDTERRRLSDVARYLLAAHMTGELAFRTTAAAVFTDACDHRIYELRTVGPMLFVTNQNFGTQFQTCTLVPSTTPLGTAIATQIRTLRRMLHGADIAQEIGAFEFDDPDLLRACHRDGDGHLRLTVNAGPRFGWVHVRLHGTSTEVVSAETGRTIRWRRRTVLAAIGNRIGAEGADSTITTLHGVADQVLKQTGTDPVLGPPQP